MEDKSKKARELIFIRETEIKLKSENYKVVLAELQKLRKSGSVLILPNILNLLGASNEEEIIKEVINFLAEIKDQKSVPVIADYISQHTNGVNLNKLIATCWQTGLDYSNHLNIFAECFIIGNYEQALESFTVIEEMIWRSTVLKIASCLEILVNHQSEIIEEKKPLYNELVKILKEGTTINKNEFPDLYLN
jgi:hypothetical protein